MVCEAARRGPSPWTWVPCPDLEAFQVPPKPVLGALLLALLGLASSPVQLHTCSVPDVLRHYRAVIFKDLQAAVRQVGPGATGSGLGSRHLHFILKNQTGATAARRRGRPGPFCGAQKVRGATQPAPCGVRLGLCAQPRASLS